MPDYLASALPSIGAKIFQALEQRRERRTAEDRQRQVDAFAEFVRRRQLEQTDEQLRQQDALRRAQLDDTVTQNEFMNQYRNQQLQQARDLADTRNQKRLDIEGLRQEMQRQLEAGRAERAAAGNEVWRAISDATQRGLDRRFLGPRGTMVVGPDGSVSFANPYRMGDTGLQTTPKTTPNTGNRGVNSSERRTLGAQQEIRRLAQDALAATTQANKEGVGYAGPIDALMSNVRTKLGVPNLTVTAAQRAYQRLTSPAARETIGTAMTASEQERLNRWLALLKDTDEKVVRQGIEGFQREADAIYREHLDLLRASGVNVDEFEKLPAKWDADRRQPAWS